MPRTVAIIAEPDEAGQRVDRFLARHLEDLSRARLQALIIEGAVVSDGAVVRHASARVAPEQRFEVHLPDPRPARPRPEAIPLTVLHEDADLLVIEKPAGLVVHPAPGHAGGTLVNALLAHCAGSLSGIGGVLRPGIVHRLDKDVSGIMVVAKSDRAHVGLAGQFSVHSVERAYDAVVFGCPGASEGAIEAPIGRDPRDRKRMAVVENGKPARSLYRVLRAAGSAASWLRVTLLTGRTHQIRVHLGSLGLQIVGDPLYGRRRPGSTALPAAMAGRIALHARVLGFEHPVTGSRLQFERPPPEAFEALLECLAREGQGAERTKRFTKR